MARALIVGCGCRGRELGGRLIDEGWAVRGTTRKETGLNEIEVAGIEAVVADPERVISVLDQIDGVTVVFWLLGSAVASEEGLAALHGPRLERLLEELVDTPVRGVVYEAAGSVPEACFEAGRAALREANKRWRVSFGVIEDDPSDCPAWVGGARSGLDAALS